MCNAISNQIFQYDREFYSMPNRLPSSPPPPSGPMFVIVENRNVNGESCCVVCSPAMKQTIFGNRKINTKFKQQKYVKHERTTQLLELNQEKSHSVSKVNIFQFLLEENTKRRMKWGGLAWQILNYCKLDNTKRKYDSLGGKCQESF